MNSYSAGKIGVSNPVKLYVFFDQIFVDNFGLTSSFRLGSFMQRDMIILHQWELVPCPGKSMGESFGEVKVILHVINKDFLDRETSPGLKCPVLGSGARADAQC